MKVTKWAASLPEGIRVANDDELRLREKAGGRKALEKRRELSSRGFMWHDEHNVLHAACGHHMAVALIHHRSTLRGLPPRKCACSNVTTQF